MNQQESNINDNNEDYELKNQLKERFDKKDFCFDSNILTIEYGIPKESINNKIVYYEDNKKIVLVELKELFGTGDLFDISTCMPSSIEIPLNFDDLHIENISKSNQESDIVELNNKLNDIYEFKIHINLKCGFNNNKNNNFFLIKSKYPFKYSCNQKYSVWKSRYNLSKYPFKFTKEEMEETKENVDKIINDILDTELKTLIEMFKFINSDKYNVSDIKNSKIVFDMVLQKVFEKSNKYTPKSIERMVYDSIISRTIKSFMDLILFCNNSQYKYIFPELQIVYDLFNGNNESISITNSNWYVLGICLPLLKHKLLNFEKLKDKVSEEDLTKMILEIRVFYILELFKLLNLQRSCLLDYIIYSLKIYSEVKVDDLYQQKESIKFNMQVLFRKKEKKI